jgi:hypothetical protein
VGERLRSTTTGKKRWHHHQREEQHAGRCARGCRNRRERRSGDEVILTGSNWLRSSAVQLFVQRAKNTNWECKPGNRHRRQQHRNGERPVGPTMEPREGHRLRQEHRGVGVVGTPAVTTIEGGIKDGVGDDKRGQKKAAVEMR